MHHIFYVFFGLFVYFVNNLISRSKFLLHYKYACDLKPFYFPMVAKKEDGGDEI